MGRDWPQLLNSDTHGAKANRRSDEGRNKIQARTMAGRDAAVSAAEN